MEELFVVSSCHFVGYGLIVFLTKLILPNQRGFFNLFPNKTSDNRGIRVPRLNLALENEGNESGTRLLIDKMLQNILTGPSWLATWLHV